MDRDDPPARAVVLELHTAANLCKERVVFSKPDIQARLEPASALPNENGTPRYDVAIEPLHAEALRVAVAPVT